MAATDLSQSLRSVLEFCAAVAVLFLVTAIAAESMQSAVIRSQTAEAFMMTSDVKVSMMAYRAETGEWPSEPAELANSSLDEEDLLGRYVDHLELGANGALSVVFGKEYPSAPIQNRRLTHRPSVSIEDPGAPIVWVCGQHPVLEGLAASGVDETDIKAINLPSACREP